MYKENHREKVAAYGREWRARNNERVAEASRRSYVANREERLASQKAYYAANPDKARDRAAIGKAFTDEAKRVPCFDCGGTFPPECMDFDHVRGEKLSNVSGMLSYALPRIAAEMEKCDLVCSNCHRIRTRARILEEIESRSF